MNRKPHRVIVGATSRIAEHCARLWVQETVIKLTLIGRDEQKLALIAADLAIRQPNTEIDTLVADFFSPEAIQALVDGVVAKAPVDTVLIAQGALPNQSECEKNLVATADALAINAVSPVLFAQAFAAHFANQNSGTLGLIGSVAGDRGRKSNIVYGAAKGLVTRFAQGLQHRFAGTAVKIVLINPGPTDTPMTVALKQQGMRMAAPERVAAQIVNGMAKGMRVVYTPKIWRFIMTVVCLLPAFIFNRLEI